MLIYFWQNKGHAEGSMLDALQNWVIFAIKFKIPAEEDINFDLRTNVNSVPVLEYFIVKAL